MGYDPGYLPRTRMRVELVEADVEIGFNLVDMARQESEAGDSSVAARVLQDADAVLQDIDQRLLNLGHADRECFLPLIAELRREVNLAKSGGSAPTE